MVTDELSERLAALVYPLDDSDWLEVNRLAASPRGRGLRFAFAAAAVAGAVAIAAPAFGLGGKLVRLFGSGEPAPPKVERSFASLDAGAPPGLATGVIAAESRKIVLPNGVALWIAPTKAGGFCLFVAGGGGGCDANRKLGFAPTFSIAGPINKKGAILGGPVLIDGSTTDDEATTVEIEFGDGDSAAVPVVWISAPINAGFFGYEVPRAHWAQGHRPTLLILRDANGNELARDPWAFRAPSFRPGPSTGLAPCLLRGGGFGCLKATVGEAAKP